MKSTHCTNCGELKPLWSTHKLCPSCRKNKPVANVEIIKPINSRGQEVIIKESNAVLTIQTTKKHSKDCSAYVLSGQYTSDGALASYRRKIYIVPSLNYTPELLTQIISAESIHLAMFALGFGRENGQLDQMKLHTWKTKDGQAKEYYGLAIEQFGLTKEDGE